MPWILSGPVYEVSVCLTFSLYMGRLTPYFRYGMTVEDVAELEEGPSGEIQPNRCTNVPAKPFLRKDLEV
jgi:hypothetical protein